MFEGLLKSRNAVTPLGSNAIKSAIPSIGSTALDQVGATPSATPTAAGADPITALLAQLLNPMPQGAGGGTDIAKLFSSLQQAKDPVGYANKMTSLPSYVPGSQSPFNTGFFNNSQPGAQVGAYPGQMKGDYKAPDLSHERIMDMYHALYKDPQALTRYPIVPQ